MSAPTTARFSDFLRGYFGLRAPEPINVLTDVMPVVNVQEEAAQLALLRDEHLFLASYETAAGGAATYAQVIIGGTAFGTPALVVVTDLFVYKPTAGVVCWYLDAAVGLGIMAISAGAGAPGLQPLDQRVIDGATRPSVAAATPAVTGAGLGMAVAAQSYVQVPLPPVILPPWNTAAGAGRALVVVNHTANEFLDAFVAGYTVPLHGSEDAT